MTGLRFPQPLYVDLATALLADRSRESCAVAFTRQGRGQDAWLVSDISIAPDEAYEKRDAKSALLRPAYLVDIANRARAQQMGIAIAHSHPHSSGTPSFSPLDDAGERDLVDYFNRRAPHASHLALVIGPQGRRARRLGPGAPVEVWEVGADLVVPTDWDEPAHKLEVYDRQVRALDEAGQRVLQRMRVGLVGLGGTGSATAQQLVRLGVADFTLIDPDTVETSNLNRLLGASSADVGRSKTAVARREIEQVNPHAHVTVLERDIVDDTIAASLAELDFIFLCTDSHASRAVVGQLAYQELIPVIDMGVSITVRHGVVSHITGRVQMLAPTLPCLVCTDALDGEQIRLELLTPAQRAADPYVVGAHVPQPAVVSLNSTMASLAVTMFLGAVTPLPATARFQLYDGVRGTVRPTTATCVADCIVCSPPGALARGRSWPLPTRPGSA